MYNTILESSKEGGHHPLVPEGSRIKEGVGQKSLDFLNFCVSTSTRL